jgi:hypothetical protein
LDGRVQQLENGACIYQSWTFNLSKKDQEEPSWIMGVVQRINQWNHPKGIQVLLKRWRVITIVYWDLLTHDAKPNGATFQAQQNTNPL